MTLLPPRSTLFPYTTLFRSVVQEADAAAGVDPAQRAALAAEDQQRPGTRPARHLRAHLRDLALHLRGGARSEEHTSELQSRQYLVCRLLLEKKKHQNMPLQA